MISYRICILSTVSYLTYLATGSTHLDSRTFAVAGLTTSDSVAIAQALTVSCLHQRHFCSHRFGLAFLAARIRCSSLHLHYIWSVTDLHSLYPEVHF